MIWVSSREPEVLRRRCVRPVIQSFHLLDVWAAGGTGGTGGTGVTNTIRILPPRYSYGGPSSQTRAGGEAAVIVCLINLSEQQNQVDLLDLSWF